MLWLVNAYDLNLVKLMQSVQTTYILTVTTCLTTETSRISATLDRQILLVKNLIPEDIRHRNLSRRDKIEVVKVGMIHLTFLVWKLSSAQS